MKVEVDLGTLIGAVVLTAVLFLMATTFACMAGRTDEREAMKFYRMQYAPEER